MSAIYDVNVASSLAQILAVLVIAVGLSTARRGALRRREYTGRTRQKRSQKLRERDDRRWAIMVQASLLGATFAIFFFVVTIALVPLVGDEPQLGSLYIFALWLSIASSAGLILALSRDLGEHSAGAD
ncbi:hypothetical protein [Agrococcus sp. Marseille-Q4369]|uniref:hypothetical protein n=1 Tax=Agrococcus sp. Marseille-Q4369 TaxID=2810513 RepID=UPI001B8C9115|nr:hypothetical protein [Agrococcus sp. Marseille-Q4369]QUW18656.1 hypothetical protein JSQ78_12845 [Agrococcus sp. Marseille-Q4369]